MQEFLKKYKYWIIGLIVIILAIIGIVSYFWLFNKQEENFYKIEIKAQNKVELTFNNEDKIIEAKCISSKCDDIDINVFLNHDFNDLEFMLKDLYKNAEEIELSLVMGKKDLDSINNSLKKKEETKDEEEKKDEAEETDSKENIKIPNQTKEENKINNDNPVSDNNNSTVPSSQPNTPSTITTNFAGLDLTGAWLWAYSYHSLKFNQYAKIPMKYGNPGSDAASFYWNGYTGYAQLFNLQDFGITKDKYCVVFTYGSKGYDNPPSTIVPIYNNGNISYKKYCLSLKVEYDKNYNEILGSVGGASASVYEWNNGTWNYVGQNGSYYITLDTIFGPLEYHVTDANEAAYDFLNQIETEKLSNEYNEKEKELRNELRKPISDEEYEEINKKLDDLYNEFQRALENLNYMDILREH